MAKKRSSPHRGGRVRVVAGTAGGLFLKIPPHFSSRPTQDRVREAIFSSLGNIVIDSCVLDLFAGTGAYGIEAMSRGATIATFVEYGKKNVQTINENLSHCHLEGNVILNDSLRFLQTAAESYFDLIFVDPPYTKEKCDLGKSPLLPLLAQTLKKGGLVIWEHDSQNIWTVPTPFALHKQAVYGETTITYLKHSESGS